MFRLRQSKPWINPSRQPWPHGGSICCSSRFSRQQHSCWRRVYSRCPPRPTVAAADGFRFDDDQSWTPADRDRRNCGCAANLSQYNYMGRADRARLIYVRGFSVRRSENRLKSRSAESSFLTPCRTHRAAILASWTAPPCTADFLRRASSFSQKPSPS